MGSVHHCFCSICLDKPVVRASGEHKNLTDTPHQFPQVASFSLEQAYLVNDWSRKSHTSPTTARYPDHAHDHGWHSCTLYHLPRLLFRPHLGLLRYGNSFHALARLVSNGHRPAVGTIGLICRVCGMSWKQSMVFWCTQQVTGTCLALALVKSSPIRRLVV